MKMDKYTRVKNLDPFEKIKRNEHTGGFIKMNPDGGGVFRVFCRGLHCDYLGPEITFSGVSKKNRMEMPPTDDGWYYHRLVSRLVVLRDDTVKLSRVGEEEAHYFELKMQ
jgi:hypothetical protein